MNTQALHVGFEDCAFYAHVEAHAKDLENDIARIGNEIALLKSKNIFADTRSLQQKKLRKELLLIKINKKLFKSYMQA